MFRAGCGWVIILTVFFMGAGAIGSHYGILLLALLFILVGLFSKS